MKRVSRIWRREIEQMPHEVGAVKKQGDLFIESLQSTALETCRDICTGFLQR